MGYGDDRHVCTVAGNRAGKGRSLIINNLLTWAGSTIVIDPKETSLAKPPITARAQKVYLLDPFSNQ